MAFGKKGGKHAVKAESPGVADLSEATELPDETGADGDVEGPFDIEDFDSAEVAGIGRLDLGSVLIPTPPAGQVQVEVTETGQPGTIDAGYRGEIKVSLINLDPVTPIAISRGDRIAQLLVQRVELPELIEVTSFDEAGLEDTTRGDGGHGSSGGHSSL